jgi:DNA primase
MEHVLEHYGVLDTLHEKGDSLVGACPIHKGTNANQFHVSRSTGKFNCFGDCHGGGIGALDFAILMEGGSKESPDDARAAALKLMA